jgi:two-component system nitrate/nitrite response regulator NarL
MAEKILLVDDHEIILEGIRTLVERSGREWQVCGMARNGQEGADLARRLRPDVIVLDITMPVLNGIDAARAIINENKDAKILLFTMHDSSRVEKEARDVGARGLVVKSQAARSLIRALDAVLSGQTFFGGLPNGESAGNATHRQDPGKGLSN